LGKREIVAAKDAGWQFLGRAKVILSTLLHLYCVAANPEIGSNDGVVSSFTFCVLGVYRCGDRYAANERISNACFV
jgi:hypothetical protein